jgi:hypothetical protein
MSEDQLEAVCAFFERIYGKANVRRKSAKDAERAGMHAEGRIRPWSVADLAQLLGPGTNAYLARKLRRTPMAIRMKRGDFAPDFIAWARRKKLANLQDEDAIRRYLEEQEN